MSFIKIKIIAKAPAKLNLHLAVFDKRPDGFHNLESIFLALDFYDILHFELVKGIKTTEIAVKGLDLGIPIEKNIVFRSLNLFRERAGWSKGVKITLEKRIPQGGGLGGGSSDAAAALLALNQLAGFPLNRASLLEIAAELGSDVPFFICQYGAALVSGCGDIIEPLKAPCLFFVLVNPGFSSGTAAAFRLLDVYMERREELTTEDTELLGVGREESTTELHGVRRNGRFLNIELRRCEGMKEISSDPAQWQFWNDFLFVFGEREKSVYDEIIRRLRDLGAAFAGLSGSGSTCFGVFNESESAQRAVASLRGKWNFVEYCESWSGSF